MIITRYASDKNTRLQCQDNNILYEFIIMLIYEGYVGTLDLRR